MTDDLALEIINKIFKMVFDIDNPFTLDQILEKFAFDVNLPKQVNDTITKEVTWADTITSQRFVTQKNMEQIDSKDGWMQPKIELNNLQELMDAWHKINLTTTEREMDSINVLKSDATYNSENVYRSTNTTKSKNVVFCDSCDASEYILASQRTTTSNFVIRTDDSQNCSNCYNVIYSNKVSNSFFIQDCFNLHECMFCSHIANKKYCIANMQFEEDEYREIKKAIISWILTN